MEGGRLTDLRAQTQAIDAALANAKRQLKAAHRKEAYPNNAIGRPPHKLIQTCAR